MSAERTPAPVLEVSGLRVSYRTAAGRFGRCRLRTGQPAALNGIDLTVSPGEILAVLGASGSGKTTLARAVLGTLPAGARLEAVWKRKPGRPAFVQQEAAASLHPLLRVETQIRDVLTARGLSRAAARTQAVRLLAEMGLSTGTARSYPHTLSGGQAQRVALARAVAAEPDLLVADEPTSALDVTLQAEIMRLMYGRVRSSGAALLLITHDIALAAEMADRVMVLLDGRCVEEGPVIEIFESPRHELTRRLLGKGERNRVTA